MRLSFRTEQTAYVCGLSCSTGDMVSMGWCYFPSVQTDGATLLLKVVAQTKLTKLTLTLTLLNPNICAHIVDTQNNFFSEFIKGIFSARCVSRVWGGASNCTTCKNTTLADVAVYLAYTSDNKWSICRFKRGAKSYRNKIFADGK